ncbi:MAG TPA: YfhO family protein [Anaerolineae bacterium]|nr:YfhO family protein [Anaerolineae bacterium]
MDRARSLSGVQKDLLAVLLLFALPAAFLSQVLFTDRVLVGDSMARYIPWNKYQDVESLGPLNEDYADTLLAYYPQILIAREIVRGGSLPLWNPYTLAGGPFLAAAPWLGFFYVPYLLFYVIDPLKSFGYVAFLHLGLAGTFMYFYLRSIECRRLSSLVGAVSFGLGGFLLANLAWLPRVSTVIWTPLLFLSIEKVLVQRRYVFSSGAALATAMCILAGNLAATVYVLLAGVLYLVFRLITVTKSKGAADALRGALTLAAAILLGVMISAVQLLPTWEVARFTERVQVTYDERVESGRSLLALATALVPDIFGNPVDRPWGRNEFVTNIPGTYGETVLYAGILPLVLAAWAVARKRDADTAFFAGLALLGLCLFLNTGLFRLLYLLPPFRIGRQLEAKILWAFAASVLAGMGFESMLRVGADTQRRPLRLAVVSLVSLGAAVLAGLALVRWLLDGGADDPSGSLLTLWYRYNVGNFLRLAGWLAACAVVLWLWAERRIRAGVLAVLVLGVMVGDLALFGWKLHPAQEADALYPQPESARFLQGDSDVFRAIRGPLSRKVYPPNSLAMYGISDVQGYSPVMIDYYVEFLQLIEEDIASTRRVYSLQHASSARSPLLDLLNTKYVITIADPGQEMEELERSVGDLELVYDGDVKIYQNMDVLPRAFFVPDYQVIEGRQELLSELGSEDFDPAATVLLEREPAPLSRAPGDTADEARVRIVEYAANKVGVEADCVEEGFLVLGDLYYPGWRALVDGVEAEVYKADYVLRAVRLGPGSHSVDFFFDPPSFKLGAAISVAGLIGVFALSAVLLRKRVQS